MQSFSPTSPSYSPTSPTHSPVRTPRTRQHPLDTNQKMVEVIPSCRLKVYKKACETIFHVKLEHDHRLLAEEFVRHYWRQIDRCPLDDQDGIVIESWNRLPHRHFYWVRKHLLTRVGPRCFFNAAFADGDDTLWKMLKLPPLIEEIKKHFRGFGYSVSFCQRGVRIQLDHPEDASEQTICPISHVRFVDPVVASDGHTYERSAIEEVIERNKPNAISPLTRERIGTTVYPNHDMRKRIIEANETDQNKKRMRLQ